MPFSKVTRNGQITIPKFIRDELHLEEGDYVEIHLKPEGIVLLPKKVKTIDPEKTYYWADLWQDRDHTDHRLTEIDPSGEVHRLNPFDKIDE